MFELNGKYGTAKVFTDLVDDESISQVIAMLNQPFAKGQTIRMMPDIHAGAGCTVGTTMTVSDKICPNLIGVDIGCGMYALKLVKREIDFSLLDNVIRKYVPSGFAIRDKRVTTIQNFWIEDLFCKHVCDLERAYLSVGTLGGGNHFIEIDRDSNGYLWLVIHTGSRHLGFEVASYYQKQAIKDLNRPTQIQETINRLKREGRRNEIEAELKKLKAQAKYNYVPKELCWCEGQLFKDYLHDMKIVQEFARINRNVIAYEILTNMHFGYTEAFETVHNYLDIENMILRKGAVQANKGQRLLIPINMRDGSLICVGKGNPDWNYSAPHGAGRLMSRSEAKKQIDLKDFEESMKDIYTTSVDISTIDEAPQAYKPMQSILDNISDTVDVIDIIKPVYNFKAS